MTAATSAEFRRRLSAGRPLLLDGPMGTELDRRGVVTELPLWSAWGLLRAPEVIEAIHRDYVAAGAQIVTTNTFRTHARSLERAGFGSRSDELTRLAVRLAADAAAAAPHRCWVAGSMSPLEDCYRPDLTPPTAVLAAEHGEMAATLAGAGVDLLLVETMPSADEAAAATRAAAATGLPVLTGFTCTPSGTLVSGETLAQAVRAVLPFRPDGMLINCTPAETLSVSLKRLARATTLPVGAYGNVGHAESERGWEATEVVSPAAYAVWARGWLAAGCRLIGGCCGTGPAHIGALAELLADRRETENDPD